MLTDVAVNNEMAQSEEQWQHAWKWLCKQRVKAPADADVWHLRFHWAGQKNRMLQQVMAGGYSLSPMQVIGRGTDRQVMWTARDALVLKWASLLIAPLLPLHARCEHLKGHCGGKASVARHCSVLQQGDHPWVMRTDVKGYYANIDKALLLQQVDNIVQSPVLRGLVHQYVHYTVEYGGEFHTPVKVICRGCPLSPLMGALYLRKMDTHFARQGQVVYARYMDDIIILAKTRWQLRRNVRQLNQCLEDHGLNQHPDKTYIGRTNKRFDWMGVWLDNHGFKGMAPRALANHRDKVDKVRRLYERALSWREPTGFTPALVSAYRSRWAMWAGSLLALAPTGPALASSTIVTPGAVGWVHTQSWSGVMPASASGNTNVLSDGDNGDILGGIRTDAWPTYPSSCMTGKPYHLVSSGAVGIANKATGGVASSAVGYGTTWGVVYLSGTVSWSRLLITSRAGSIKTQRVNGTVVYNLGHWDNMWDFPNPTNFTHPGMGSSSSTNTSPREGVLCPSWANVADASDPLLYDTATRPWGSTYNLQMRVYAVDPAPPGRYYVRPMIISDCTTGPIGLGRVFCEGEVKIWPDDVIVSNSSCAVDLSEDRLTLALSDAGHAGRKAGTRLSVRCTTGDSQQSISVTIHPTWAATGVSATEIMADPYQLPAKGDHPGAVVVRGSYGSDELSCNKSSIAFDKSDGPSLGSLTPSPNTTEFSADLSFMACPGPSGAKAGKYVAQATVGIVQR